MQIRAHELKIQTPYFDAVITGKKKAELRKNDRDYRVGDMLILNEVDGLDYTKQKSYQMVTHILPGGQFGIDKEYVILSIEPAPRDFVRIYYSGETITVNIIS